MRWWTFLIQSAAEPGNLNWPVCKQAAWPGLAWPPLSPAGHLQCHRLAPHPGVTWHLAAAQRQKTCKYFAGTHASTPGHLPARWGDAMWVPTKYSVQIVLADPFPGVPCPPWNPLMLTTWMLHCCYYNKAIPILGQISPKCSACSQNITTTRVIPKQPEPISVVVSFERTIRKFLLRTIYFLGN